MFSGTLASAPFAPAPTPKAPEEPADAPIRQRVATAYTAKQAAAAEVQKAERALQAGDKAKQQALQHIQDMEAKLAAARDKYSQSAASCTDLRGKLDEANRNQALASQKLEALRVLQEREPADFGPAPAPAPATASPKPDLVPATLQQIVAAFNINNFSADHTSRLESVSAGLDAGRVREVLDVFASMAAEVVASQRQPQVALPCEEAACQYGGTPEQILAQQDAAACVELCHAGPADARRDGAVQARRAQGAR